MNFTNHKASAGILTAQTLLFVEAPRVIRLSRQSARDRGGLVEKEEAARLFRTSK